MFVGALVSTVLTAGIESLGWSILASFAISAIIDVVMPQIFKSYENIHQVQRFISKSLTMRF